MIIRERHGETCVCVWIKYQNLYIFIKSAMIYLMINNSHDILCIPVLITYIYLNEYAYEVRIHDKNLRSRIKK